MQYSGTVSYILLILGINVGYTAVPFFTVLGCELSLMDPIAGIVYLMRDFAQRELGHRVLVAMVAGIVLSYWLADPMIAKASVCAFAIGELIDWAIFTFSGKPLSDRLLWSSLISAPVDTFVFLYLIQHMNALSFTLMLAGKIVGVMLVWGGWSLRYPRNAHLPNVS